MKSNLFCLLVLILPFSLSAQIGIGTDEPSAFMEVVGSSTDSPLKIENIQTGRGNYITVNPDGEWQKTNRQHITSFVMPTVVSSGSLLINSYSGFALYTPGSDFDSSLWTLIPGMNTSIEVEFPNNIINLQTEGSVQFGSTNFNTGMYISYAIGIFVNNKLVATRVFNLMGTANDNENMKWEVTGQVSDLLVGANEVKVAISKRGSSGAFTGDFVVAGPSTAAGTTQSLSNFETQAYLQIMGSY